MDGRNRYGVVEGGGTGEKKGGVFHEEGLRLGEWSVIAT